MNIELLKLNVIHQATPRPVGVLARLARGSRRRLDSGGTLRNHGPTILRGMDSEMELAARLGIPINSDLLQTGVMDNNARKVTDVNAPPFTVLSAPPQPERVELLGLQIDAYSPDGLIDRLISDSRRGVGGYLMTPNLDNLRSLTRERELMNRAQTADIRVADGMPLLWASRIQRTALPSRVAGSDLIFTLSEAAAQSGRSVFLLGGEPGTADDAAATLVARFPDLEVVGTLCPPFGFERDSDQMAEIHSRLAAAAPDFVYIGLPFPKASALVADIRDLLPGAWFLGIGISFSFVCGNVSRAPQWMQRIGLEWIHRLQQEPRRLARRYLLEGLPFAIHLFGASLAKRWTQNGVSRGVGAA